MAKSTRPLVRIYTGNGEFIDREMNDDEFNQHEIDLAAHQAKQIEEQTKLAQRQAIADRLGLTADELKILLG